MPPKRQAEGYTPRAPTANGQRVGDHHFVSGWQGCHTHHSPRRCASQHKPVLTHCLTFANLRGVHGGRKSPFACLQGRGWVDYLLLKLNIKSNKPGTCCARRSPSLCAEGCRESPEAWSRAAGMQSSRSSGRAAASWGIPAPARVGQS